MHPAPIAPSLQAFWRSRFSGVPPIGYRLRETFPERWLRIHSLPEAKRRPENADEQREVLARANRAATLLLGERAPCWIVVPELELEDDVVPEMRELVLRPAMTITDDDDDPATFWSAQVTWSEGAFDEILRAISEDRRWAVWIAVETGNVFAPYDGGVDLIAATSERRDALRSELGAWVSTRDGGL